MNNSNYLHVDLLRRNTSQNMARFYGLSVEPDLVGVWVFTRNWGRIGSSGQSKCQSFDSSQDV
ncbi:WGR domain-containing protein [Ochrobactrum quorumnocens]|uniref:WGR domain-containing protein n=1 Tax=Ochrobactrum quorumnocens TaxID=271865 RepID=A0A5N1KA11_9HYPH|nr:WGR domain-containing protein [[Ochrobactrum] quorumnocens]KAA9371084.1 WGR domain-containing protein [[Ochrobactrum] quorumnocens]MBD7993446.1 WGR domain-containing protein [Ochrobactrum gallinarum]